MDQQRKLWSWVQRRMPQLTKPQVREGVNEALAWADLHERRCVDWTRFCANWLLRGERMKRERQAERIDRYGPRQGDFEKLGEGLGQVLRMVPGGKK